LTIWAFHHYKTNELEVTELSDELHPDPGSTKSRAFARLPERPARSRARTDLKTRTRMTLQEVRSLSLYSITPRIKK
jgi:hypothetical protein